MRDNIEILLNRRKEIDEQIKKLQAEYNAIGYFLHDYLDRKIGEKIENEQERM